MVLKYMKMTLNRILVGMCLDEFIEIAAFFYRAHFLNKVERALLGPGENTIFLEDLREEHVSLP
jgi:hypothetical protein